MSAKAPLAAAIACVLIASALAPLSIHALSAEQSADRDLRRWTVYCRPDDKSAEKSCAVVQATRSRDGSNFVRLAFAYDPARNLEMNIQTNPMFGTPKRINITINGHDAGFVDASACNDKFCDASLVVDNELRLRLRRADELGFIRQSSASEGVLSTIQASGLNDALDTLDDKMGRTAQLVSLNVTDAVSGHVNAAVADTINPWHQTPWRDWSRNFARQAYVSRKEWATEAYKAASLDAEASSDDSYKVVRGVDGTPTASVRAGSFWALGNGCAPLFATPVQKPRRGQASRTLSFGEPSLGLLEGNASCTLAIDVLQGRISPSDAVASEAANSKVAGSKSFGIGEAGLLSAN